MSALGILLCASFGVSSGAITGTCANCHTMHNSQGGVTMNGKSTPNIMLLRSTCMGCHAMGGAEKVATLGSSKVPQVYHIDASGDLAGGNFAYITGDKGTGASDAKGHNVIELNNPDSSFTTYPPGHRHEPVDFMEKFNCAGTGGCHGRRIPTGPSGIEAMKGAHHRNVDGKCDVASDVYDSYRFLYGVKGLENTGTNRWQNASDTDHNEYFGSTLPRTSGCTSVCHPGAPGWNPVRPDSHTISHFCGSCHYSFYIRESVYTYVPGVGTVKPLLRHPSDVILPNTGEYVNYTTYDTSVPVARTTVPNSASSTVTPGTDVVMCLSCHGAHATDYPDILKWDYDAIIAGGGGSGGCFKCHAGKK